jgi:hypothetical protein
MDELFKRSTLEILLIFITFFGSIFAILYFLFKNRISIGGKSLSFSQGNPLHIAQHTDYLSFSLIHKDINRKLEDKYRVWCIENGITKMTESKWDIYKRERVDLLEKIITQFFTENFNGLDVTMLMFNENLDFTQRMRNHFSNLFEHIREEAKIVDSAIDILKNNLDVYIEEKINQLQQQNPQAKASVLGVVLSTGKKMIEIHELQNRTLVRRQMDKVEEIMSTAYTENTLKFLTLLNKTKN